MKKTIITAFFVMLSFSTALASSNISTDDKGNTVGTIDGKKVDLHTDKDGVTKGTIGSARINTRTDQLGNTSGTVGKTIIDTNTLNTTNQPAGALENSLLKPRTAGKIDTSAGAIQNSIINSYIDNPGNTTGKGSAKNINKRSTEKLGEGFE